MSVNIKPNVDHSVAVSEIKGLEELILRTVANLCQHI